MNKRIFLQTQFGTKITDYCFTREGKFAKVVDTQTAESLGIDKTQPLHPTDVKSLPLETLILDINAYQIQKNAYLAQNQPKMYQNQNVITAQDTLQPVKVQGSPTVAVARPQKSSHKNGKRLLKLTLKNTTAAEIVVPVFDSLDRWKYKNGFNPATLAGLTVSGTGGANALDYLEKQTSGRAIEISKINFIASDLDFYGQGDLLFTKTNIDLTEGGSTPQNLSNMLNGKNFDNKLQETESGWSTMVSDDDAMIVKVPANQTITINMTVCAETYSRLMDLN